MAKDILIELLQDRQNVRIGSQLLTNSEFNNSTGWTSPEGSCTDAFVFTGGDMVKNTVTACARASIPQVLVEGHEYEVSIAIRNYNRSGQLIFANHGSGGSNVNVINSTIVPNGGAGTGQDWGFYKKRWRQGQAATKLSVYANQGTEIEIGNLRVYRTAADKSSVFGVLDASSTEDFPLAITFSVNDPSNIDARKGAYSKTFQIPATANNNVVLKHFAIPNSTLLDAEIFAKIDCRIKVGNLFSLTGLIQIKDVERLNDKPILYSCVFLGDNLAWSTVMGDKYLSDLQLENSTNLQISAKNIIKSWESDSCDSTTTVAGVNSVNTSPVVYPVVSYGMTNASGLDYGSAFQLFREQWEIDYMDNVSYNISQTGFLGGNQYNSLNPVNDWRPLVWIYNMMNKIFLDAGYKIESNFIESDNFKKLVYASPNFKYHNPNERKQNHSYIGNFKNNACSPNSNNLMFFAITAQWDFSVPNQSGGYSSSDFTWSTPYPPIQWGGTCGTCSANDCGSGRFQPAPNVITTSGGMNQQDLKIKTLGLGTNSSPFYNAWVVDTAGYYEISTENIYYYFTWNESDWSGSGLLSNNTYSGMKVYGNIVNQVKRVGEQDWQTVDAIDNGSATAISQQTDCNNDYSFGGTLPTRVSVHYLNKGDTLRMTFGVAPTIKVSNPNQNWTGTTSVSVGLTMRGSTYDDINNYGGVGSSGKVNIVLINEDTPVYGGVYDLQNILPNDQKQIEFIKGVAHSFNLQFSTDEPSKTVFIEPYNDFYLPIKNAIDWTHKLARNLPDTQRFIESNFTRRLIFKYKTDDKDWRVNKMSEDYFQSVGDNYPEIRDLGNTYPAGETIFENPFFSGTYDSMSFTGGLLTYNQNMYAASLWNNDQWYHSKVGDEHQPRMLNYTKRIMPTAHDPLWQGFRAEDGATLTSDIFNNYKVQTADVTDFTFGSFPAANANLDDAFYCSATFMDRNNISNGFPLCYGNFFGKDYDPATNDYSAISSSKGYGLYDRFYKPMMDSLISRPKVRVCYINLKITDIINLDFRKMVYIDESYYKIVRVIDYKPQSNTPTKVELHQFSIGEGATLPTDGAWVNVNVNTGGGTYNPDGSSGEIEPPLGF